MQPLKSFNKLIQKSHETPIVVQFFAKWCGPCKVLKPTMTRLANQAEGRWVLALIDVEKHQNIAAQFNVRSIPDVHMIYKGESVANFKGSKSTAIIEKWLENNLPKRRRKTKHYDIESLLKIGNIDGAVMSILEKVDQENPKAQVPKILMAMLTLGKNNPQAMQLINQLDQRGEWASIVKTLRDLVDIDIDERDDHTPTHSPYNPTPVLANEKIDVNNFNPDLLSRLVHDLINEVRAARGVMGLGEDPTLTAAAIDHNQYQIKHDVLTHEQKSRDRRTAMDRVNSFGGGFRSVGENVQYQGMKVRDWGNRREILTDSYVNTAKTIVENWVNSPGHYRNLINTKFDSVGTAVGWNPENFSIFATQVFGK